MNTLRKVDRVLNTTRVVLLVAIMIFTISICTMNIVLRYLIKGVAALRPYPWVDELMRMGAIWIAFLAAGLGVKSGAHISLESFTEKHLPPKVTAILKKVALVVVLITLAVLIYYGIKQTIKESRSFLQNIHISNAWFYSAIPVGCGYLFYDYLLILIFGKHPFADEAKDEPTSGSF